MRLIDQLLAAIPSFETAASKRAQDVSLDINLYAAGTLLTAIIAFQSERRVVKGASGVASLVALAAAVTSTMKRSNVVSVSAENIRSLRAAMIDLQTEIALEERAAKLR